MPSLDDTRILVAVGTATKSQQIEDILRTAGSQVFSVDCPREVQRRIEENDIDLLILDVVLGETSGIVILADLRQSSDVGIVMVGEAEDRDKQVIALEVGADDFILGPLHSGELVARLRAVLRRVKGTRRAGSRGECCFRFETFTLYPHRRELIADGDGPLSMSSTEFSLLETFLRNPNEILSRQRLLVLTYGDDISISERAIDVHINRLRYKLEDDPKEPRLLKTIRHRGYLFSAAVQPINVRPRTSP